MLWMHSCTTLFLCRNTIISITPKYQKLYQKKWHFFIEKKMQSHIYYSVEKAVLPENCPLIKCHWRWGQEWHWSPVLYITKQHVPPLIIRLGIFTRDQLALSWVYSARNACEVRSESTSGYSSLSADDSWCQPLCVSIPIYILKVSTEKGCCDWSRNDSFDRGTSGAEQFNRQ